MILRPLAWVALLGLAIGSMSHAQAQQPPNILLIIGDDMGVETLASYGLGDNPPATAALDELARDGVRFDNFWAQPVCSPTRATVITGRYGFRTGIGRPVGGGPLPEAPAKPAGAPAESNGAPNAASAEDRALPRPHLLLSEYTLPNALKEHADVDYATAAFGKWHLAMPANGWTDHPNTAGFDHFAGLMGGGPESYFAWNKVVDGEVSGAVGYTPTDKVDDALVWLDDRSDEPWFLWLAFNLGHTPLHLPPPDVLQSDYSDHDPQSVPEEHWVAYFNAMVEAMDTEIARLLDSLEPEVRDNTYVIFMGDNGTYDPVVSAPFRHGHAKGTIYEGGVNVPLIVSGPDIEHGSVSEALVNSTDLFATILEMAGVEPESAVPEGVTIDSVSFMASLADPAGPSVRDWLYADEFFGGFDGVEGADYAMRNHRYKLLRFEGVEEFYDLETDPYEHDNLLEGELTENERAEYEALGERIRALRASR
ncbi:MAG: sulfatase-like hydrolase/transferase [Gammaproteobacteria bacterium]